MRIKKSKSPPQRPARFGGRQRAAERSQRVEGGPGDVYSVNALSKITGADRRTIDKAVVGIQPVKVEGKTKFFRLADVEAALKAKPAGGLKEEKLREEIRKLRLANDEKEKLNVARVLVADSIRRVQGKVRPLLLQKLMNEYPAAVAGMDVPQAREYGGRLFDQVMREFQSWADIWLTAQPK